MPVVRSRHDRHGRPETRTGLADQLLRTTIVME
jgi:hypothetical protein